MIRAHLATFPPRAGILMQTVAAILPQVERLFICLNEYDTVPAELQRDERITTLIPDRNLKDAGKFAFTPADDDIVFTIDDDIVYPPDYVAHTMSFFDRLDPAVHVLGYLGHVWNGPQTAAGGGWTNYMFANRSPRVLKVDLLGTGTACQLGRHMPRLDEIEDAAGFVDIRHARHHARDGRWMWIVSRQAGFMTSTMTKELWGSSLFKTVNCAKPPQLRSEIFNLIRERTPHSGTHFRALRKAGLLPAAVGAPDTHV